jgi:hypothetical protein
MVRAKFTLQSITKHHGNQAGQGFVFGAVSADNVEENKRFHKYTPSGQLTMYVDNPPAQEFFELGKSYYLDFSKAE